MTGSPQVPQSRFPRVALLSAILLISGISYFLAIRPAHHWGGDFSVYVWQARNIANSRPMFQSTFVVTPRSALNHPAAYPPVPSLLLAPVYAAYGLDYRALKLALSFFAWASLPVWYLVGRRMGLNPVASAIATGLFSLGSILYFILDSVGSDAVFIFFSAATLWALLWVEQEKWTERKPFAAALLVSALMLLSVATRATGLALPLAFVLWKILQFVRSRRLQPAAASVGRWVSGERYAMWTVLLVGAGLVGYNLFIYNASGQYGRQVVFDPRLNVRNIVFYLRMAAPLWSPAPTLLRYVLSGAALLLAMVGLVRRFPNWSVIEVYIVSFYGMLAAYTGNNDFRYAIPILPLVLFLATDAALFLGKKLLPGNPALPAWILAGLAAAATVFNIVSIDRSPITEGIAKPAFQEVTGFLRHTAPDTLILSWNPRVFALYTDRPSALFPSPAESFESQIPPADHVLLVKYMQPLDEEQLGAYLAAAHPRVEFSNAEFTVYRIR